MKSARAVVPDCPISLSGMTFHYAELADGSYGANLNLQQFSPSAQTGTPLTSTVLPAEGVQPFSGSVLNTAIPGSPTIDSNSAAIVANLVSQWGAFADKITMAAHFGGFGAYYLTGSSQPTVPVNVVGTPQDTAANQIMSQVPVPPQAIGTASLCSAIGIWQPSTHQVWELGEPAYTMSGWQAYAAAVLSDTGSGLYAAGSFPGIPVGTCGLSLWGLAIKVVELQAGVIPHAVALSLPYVAPGHVGHATADAGLSVVSTAIQTGVRFQLTPGTNISAMSTIGQVVATAIETYGAYVVGTNLTGLSVLCEDPGQYATDPYPGIFGVGISEATALNNMPVSSFRVVDN